MEKENDASSSAGHWLLNHPRLFFVLVDLREFEGLPEVFILPSRAIYRYFKSGAPRSGAVGIPSIGRGASAVMSVACGQPMETDCRAQSGSDRSQIVVCLQVLLGAAEISHIKLIAIYLRHAIPEFVFVLPVFTITADMLTPSGLTSETFCTNIPLSLAGSDRLEGARGCRGSFRCIPIMGWTRKTSSWWSD